MLKDREKRCSMERNDQQQITGASVDPEMALILEAMLEADETITARAIARKHSKLGHASSITRSPERRQLVEAYQKQQKQRREWVERAPKRSHDQLAAQLAKKDIRIAELEHQAEILRISHLAMIRVVGEMGGISKLLKLYEGYRGVRGELDRMGAIPKSDLKRMKMNNEYQDDDPTA